MKCVVTLVHIRARLVLSDVLLFAQLDKSVLLISELDLPGDGLAG